MNSPRLARVLIATLAIAVSSRILAAEVASSPTLTLSIPPSEAEHIDFKSLPLAMAQALKDSDRRISALESEARTALEQYLKAEQAGQFAKSFRLLHSGVTQRFLNDETNQAVVNDIRLYLDPPDSPAPHQREAIARVKAMVEAKNLDLEAQDPALWAYQWSHSTGSIDGRFETTGPYTNEFRLRDFVLADLHMASEDLAVGYVTEEIAVPIEIILKRLSVYLLKPENGQWRIYAHRGADGPRVHQWLGLRTILWPDQLEYKIQNPQATNEELP